MIPRLVDSYRQMVLALVNALPGVGPVSTLQTQWVTQLTDPLVSLESIQAIVSTVNRVERFTVPSAFLTLLKETPQPLNPPAVWAVDAEANTHDPVVGSMALADILCPPLWVGYAHPNWQWTPAGLGWLLWQATIYQDQPALSRAKAVYDWLSQKGYGHLLLENAMCQLAHNVSADKTCIPPSECPLSKHEWQQAQALLPVLKRGLIISASLSPTGHPLFGPVAQSANAPWTILHTGWLWLLDHGLHGGDDTNGPDLMAVNALLRQSIDTVVLHRMLTVDEEGVPA